MMEDARKEMREGDRRGKRKRRKRENEKDKDKDKSNVERDLIF